MVTTTDKPVATGIQLTPLDEPFREDPYPILADLRTREPAHRDTELNRVFLTRHDEVHDVLRSKAMWVDARKARDDSFHAMFLRFREEQPSMLMMDDPDHRRLRALVSRPFMPKSVESWRTRVRAVVNRVLGAIDAAEPFDLIAEFAGPVPTVVIAEMLGIDTTDYANFKAWSDAGVQVAFNPFPEPEAQAVADAAQANLDALFRTEIANRHASLGDDLISDMVRAEEAGETLTDDEIVIQCNLLLVAGNVTTTDLIGNGVKALLEHPDQLDKLRARPELIQNAVEEVLRYDTPVVNSARIAHQDMNIGGCPIQQGETVYVSLAAANRDPDAYPDPDNFDIERKDTHHQAFGGGNHHCLGAPLSRIEAQEAILALFKRFEGLRIAERGYTYHAIPSFRGLSEFWVEP
jgi:cytochrome P450